LCRGSHGAPSVKGIDRVKVAVKPGKTVSSCRDESGAQTHATSPGCDHGLLDCVRDS